MVSAVLVWVKLFFIPFLILANNFLKFCILHFEFCFPRQVDGETDDHHRFVGGNILRNTHPAQPSSLGADTDAISIRTELLFIKVFARKW
jgi:hypothetical protein